MRSLSARRGNDGVDSANLEQWIFGYLTSLNRWVPGIVNIARGSNHEGLALWVDHFCSENPEKDVADAAEFLFLALRKNQERSNDQANLRNSRPFLYRKLIS